MPAADRGRRPLAAGVTPPAPRAGRVVGMGMLRKSRWVALVVALCTGLAACASVGGRSKLEGVWKPPEEPAREVTFHFRSESGDRGTVRVNLGDGGEAFEGTYVEVSSNTQTEVVQPIILAWAPTWTKQRPFLYPDPWMEDITGIASFVRHYTGKLVAALEGEQQTMRCRFDLVDPEKGVRAGASGDCQLSGGGTVVVRREK